MRAFALALMLVAAPAAAANEWGVSPIQDAAILQAVHEFGIIGCPGYTSSIPTFHQAIARLIPESQLGGEVRSRTSAIIHKMLMNKPAACAKALADFGPEGRLVPGILIPGRTITLGGSNP